MMLQRVFPKFSGVYVVHTQGLGHITASKQHPQKKPVPKQTLRAFRQTQHEKLVKGLVAQSPQKTFLIQTPERNAQFLEFHWQNTPQKPLPSMADLHHWLKNTLQKITRWEADQLQHHARSESTQNIQKKAQALVQQAKQLDLHWKHAEGMRFLLFVDDALGEDATHAKRQFFEQMKALNKGETVYLKEGTAMEGAKDKPGVNQRQLNYAWYHQTLMAAHQQKHDSLTAPKLDGDFTLKLKSMTLAPNNHYAYRVHGYLNRPQDPKTWVSEGAVPASTLVLPH